MINMTCQSANLPTSFITSKYLFTFYGVQWAPVAGIRFLKGDFCFAEDFSLKKLRGKKKDKVHQLFYNA